MTTRPRHDMHDDHGPHDAPSLVTAHDALVAARRAQERLCRVLRGRPGVCGVGLTRRGDGYALRVNVVHPGVHVPEVVDGVPVEVRTTGRLTAHTAR
ncbi:hypothetical protein OMK64_12860 [Cellulomonas fimi]|uniref:hypothetical protein n=1 Tax=Cellulomonas fimi TaxID=1708 RepID=UPI00234D7F44|nr:hypothetical protein [Cellulomonas fimi]MDC7122424.1 hypothetical protein [Cellulomonas fimi]